MQLHEKLTEFFKSQLPDAVVEGEMLKATCPFCKNRGRRDIGRLTVNLNSQSYFFGYFHCRSLCTPGGFAPHFARQLGIDPNLVPAYDPDRDPYVVEEEWPLENMNQEAERLHATLNTEMHQYFAARAIGIKTLKELRIGFNGRYLVYPYFRENDCCYAAHCISPNRTNEEFWLGDDRFSGGGLQIFNVKDIKRCEDGALFVVEGEANLLSLRELGYPGVAVPRATDLEEIDHRRFDHVKTIFLLVSNTPESETASRTFAGKLGFKVRLLQWLPHRKRGFNLTQLALENLDDFPAEVNAMIASARAYSPFRSPAREYQVFCDEMERQQSESYQDMRAGLPAFDRSLGGIHGLNIIGGPPKSGKSILAIQLATGIASRQMPVIYYDFENGRQKIYQRTLARMSRLPVQRFLAQDLLEDELQSFETAKAKLKAMLEYFRVINDRKLTPEIMRRHIDFLRHETGRDEAVVVVDSLHKLPFKDFSERRTGIDAWLRELESIRDELQVGFLVISELHREEGGDYNTAPHMGLFKGSGDIEYTADNALIFLPEWQLEEIGPDSELTNALWLVASREYSPGLIARYRLDFPFWGFIEDDG